MSSELMIFPASGPSETAIVKSILNERVSWLQERGSDQWSTHTRWEPELTRAVEQGLTWLLWQDLHTAVGTITISERGDPDFWTEEERQTPAFYISKLATRISARGRGLGSLMLDHAMNQARLNGKREIRIDVWKTATQLHRYYEQLGWSYLRTVDLPDRYSGTLFTHPVHKPHPHGVPPVTIASPGRGPDLSRAHLDDGHGGHGEWMT